MTEFWYWEITSGPPSTGTYAPSELIVEPLHHNPAKKCIGDTKHRMDRLEEFSDVYHPSRSAEESSQEPVNIMAEMKPSSIPSYNQIQGHETREKLNKIQDKTELIHQLSKQDRETTTVTFKPVAVIGLSQPCLTSEQRTHYQKASWSVIEPPQ